MIRNASLAVAAALFIVFFAFPANAEQTDLARILSGCNVMEQLTLSDLAHAKLKWYRFRLAGQRDAGPGPAIAAMFGGGNAGEFYTAGRQIDLGGTEYLIAYTIVPGPIDMEMLTRRGATPGDIAPITAQSALALSLLNLRTLPGMVGLRPFDLASVIAENQSQSSTADSLANVTNNRLLHIQAQSNAKRLMLGVTMYQQDYQEMFPPMKDPLEFKKAIYPYVKDESVFVDPQIGAPFELNTSLSGVSMATLDSPSIMVAIYSSKPDSFGLRVVAYADGHTAAVTDADWQKLKEASHIP